MTDGSTDSAGRPTIDWKAADFLDADALDRELRRVFSVCHDCRRWQCQSKMT
jgi:glycerol-3-phosphate dehydrogenase subunit C